MPSSTMLIHSRKAPQSWRVVTTAISPLVSYRPCVTYSSIPLSLPRLLNSLSPRIYLIFCLTDCPYPLLRSWFHNTNASPTSMIVSSSLGPPWPARPSHLNSFVHRPTKEILPWINPFNELASIPSSLIQHQLCASGRRQTSHVLIDCAQLCGYSVILPCQSSLNAQSFLITSSPTLYVSLHT